MTDDGRAVLDFADRTTILKIVLGFLVSVALLLLVAVGVGVEDLRRVLAGAKLRWLAAGTLSTALCLAAWAKAWDVVLGVVGVDVSFRNLVVTYYAATFANYVTPLGQAGGEPFIAYVLSRDTGASYEDSLASVVTADLLNLMPFVSFAAVGFAALLWQATLPDRVEPLAVGLVVLGIGVPVVAAAGWRFRFPLGRLFLRVLAPVADRTSRLSLASVRERMFELNESFQRIAREPRELVRALAFSYVGWAFFALPLYFAGLTVGVPLDFLLVFFIVPASTLAGLVPSPGGLGGVEVALVALLVALTGLGAAGAYAVALVYRLASYWFALGVGGTAALYVIRRA
ncbi:MAG: YbhN family protein [Haloarculaceae archaeon]